MGALSSPALGHIPGLVTSGSEYPCCPTRFTVMDWNSTELQGEVTSIAIEFGASKLGGLPELQVNDCPLHNFNDPWAALSETTRADLVDFVFPATTDWKRAEALWTQQKIHLAVHGLRRDQQIRSMESRQLNATIGIGLRLLTFTLFAQ
jgi:hypothetical protein